MRYAIFSSLGLGDGLLALILSNNLHVNGHDTVTFHPFLSDLQQWFPKLPLSPFPKKVEEELSSFDRFIIILENSPWMNLVTEYCLKKRRKETLVINAIATDKHDYPFWEEAKLNGKIPVVQNYQTVCKEILKLPQTTPSNGLVLPSHVKPHRFTNRIVIHPTSSRKGKNWPKSSFLKLKKELEKQGFEVVFLVSPKEQSEWKEAPNFSSLSDLATACAESQFMIGNDSGIGHLASLLGLPTLTICRSEKSIAFWRPSWSKGAVVTPSSRIPNIKWLRLRDRFWQRAISVSKVLSAFQKLNFSQEV